MEQHLPDWKLCICVWMINNCTRVRSFYHDTTEMWATSSQNQHNGLWAQRRLRYPGWSVFAVCMKKVGVLSYPLSAQQRLIRLGRCPGWSESLLGTQSFCWFCHEAAHIVFIHVCLSSQTITIEPRHDKTCLREFPTRPDANRPAQPQKLARVLKFQL